MPDALKSLNQLKDAGHKLYLISYCGERRAKETKQSLLRTISRKDLFDGLYFVVRTTHKADVCRYLGCDIMIDDKIKILNNIHRVAPTINLLWFVSPDSNLYSPDMTQVVSWLDIMKTINDAIIHQTTRHQPNSTIVLTDKLHLIK